MDIKNSEFYIEGLGIDQGYANCGIAVLRVYPMREKNNIEILKNYTITTSASENMNKRLEQIYNSIIDIMNTYEIEVVGCEKLFVNNPMKTRNSKADFFRTRNKSADIVNTSFVTGIIFLISSMYNINIYEFPPTSVKKRVTNNGKATKEELAKAINEIASSQNIEIKTDHESDAIGICISAIKEKLEPKKETKKTRKTKKIKEQVTKKKMRNSFLKSTLILKHKEDNYGEFKIHITKE